MCKLDEFIYNHYQKQESEYPYFEDYIYKVLGFEFILRYYQNGISEILLFFRDKYIKTFKVKSV
mgnify:CR=1 FL=1